ncbi:hypothetical protein [Caminibacter pacificus]|uniref:Uncharacterized protein n=1 Tax=Caminibacter pacificus TaxID=1424653 RepID=A0AAJ4UY92_9BACT|nr:hypothetical protein [Caminibacter pacificus]QCI28600.1 hypothetical protein C6V80_06370 [Caminibacter pacificus]ROR40671.1 hypothetical protein EDC58_0150 [Caminibacter pacificus]
MKKIVIFSAIASFLLASQTTERILKKEFDSNILPQVVNDLNKNGESVIILRTFKSNKGITLKAYKVKEIYSNTTLFETKGDYNIGYKYYTKYILKPAKIKVTDFVKIIRAKNEEDLNKLFANNAEKLKEILKKEKQFIALEGIEKIIKRNKLNDLKEFLKGVIAGKVPANCS